jgi:2-C-methyl-D-erythritol 4-phosphate cytidylyltransferase
MATKTVIITAGGIGNRMKSDIPKQFLLVHGKCILEHTINSFFDYDNSIQIILTLPENWINYWNEYCLKNSMTIKHKIISGGKERYHSIQNALAIAEGELIAIHDGVRPLVSQQTLINAFDLAEKRGNAVPIFPLKESIRYVELNHSKSLDRNFYYAVQTPQIFHKTLIFQAYNNPFHQAITDDASLVEEIGASIHTFIGNEENIKITTPFDLKIAELYL